VGILYTGNAASMAMVMTACVGISTVIFFWNMKQAK